MSSFPIAAAFQGSYEGYMFGTIKRETEAVVAGREYQYSAINNIMLTGFTASYLTELFSGCSRASWAFFAENILMQIGTAFCALSLAYKDDKRFPEFLKKHIHLINECYSHIPAFQSSLALIPSIALVALTGNPLAAFYLLARGIFFLDEHHWLPKSIQYALHRYQEPISTVLSIGYVVSSPLSIGNVFTLVGTSLLVVVRITSLALSIMDKLYSSSFYRNYPSSDETCLNCLQNADLSAGQHFIVDPRVVDKLPVVPEGDPIANFNTAFDRIPWENYKARVLNQLSVSEDWNTSKEKKRAYSANAEDPDFKICKGYIREKANLFIDKAFGRTYVPGEIVSKSDVMTSKMKCILGDLNNIDLDDSFGFIMSFALESGARCGSNITQFVKDHYRAMRDTMKRVSKQPSSLNDSKQSDSVPAPKLTFEQQAQEFSYDFIQAALGFRDQVFSARLQTFEDDINYRIARIRRIDIIGWRAFIKCAYMPPNWIATYYPGEELPNCGKMVHATDMHELNIFRSLYGRKCGLESFTEAQEDPTVQNLGSFFPRVMGQEFTNFEQSAVFYCLNPDKLVDYLTEKMNEEGSGFNRADFSMWWTQWVNQQETSKLLDAESADTCRDALTSYPVTLFGRTLIGEDNRITKDCVRGMLLALGILRVSSEVTKVTKETSDPSPKDSWEFSPDPDLPKSTYIARGILTEEATLAI